MIDFTQCTKPELNILSKILLKEKYWHYTENEAYVLLNMQKMLKKQM